MKIKLLHIVTAVTLLTCPKIYFAQVASPTLGTAADFVLFSSNGALSNTGVSQITGNVGTNNGSSTAFGNVNGVMNDNNGASAQCATDLLSAYNQLNATVATFFPAPLLGNGQILNTGVYSISASSTLNQTLTLDGQGNANAVFIFKIQGSFSANANAKVILINSALACNVFWKIEGLVSLASGSTMRGTIIANNSAINMNTGVTLEGRALSTTGAVTVDGVLAYTPIGCGSPNLTGPASPTLASIACYALFSGNGSVTNAGVTNVLGDVGTNVGLTTGFSTLTVAGVVHPIPDISTAACANDLLNVHSYLNLLPYDIQLLYPAQFGKSLVLTPHVYRLNGATTFIDTLFLNARGNANAVFVIQVFGALSTGTYAQVILTNGAQAKNVFWQVEGGVNINNYSNFVGTIIVNNGAVSLNMGTTINGRVLTTNGAFSTSSITVNLTPGCSSIDPNITTQPTNQTVCSGNSTNFSVISTGVGLTYQWRKGVVNLVNGGSISGATTATLTINPAVAVNTATNYNVVITGSSTANATSTNATLTVNTSPSISAQPTNQTGCVGDLISYFVSASGSGLTYQWRKGTVNLVNGGSISGANYSLLTINPMAASDLAANYNVVIGGVCTPTVNSVNVSLLLCSTTGIKSNNMNNSIVIYPNPFTTSLVLTINDASQINNSELKIYNVLGAEVMNVSITNQSTTIETGNLSSGVYFYKVIGNNKIIQSGKLISQ